MLIKLAAAGILYNLIVYGSFYYVLNKGSDENDENGEVGEMTHHLFQTDPSRKFFWMNFR